MTASSSSVSTSPRANLSPTTVTTGAPLHRTEHEAVSAALYAALPPSREDIEITIRAGLNISLPRLMTWAHPITLAKYMSIPATCLQSAHPQVHAGVISCLSESPRQLMRRLVDSATDLVTGKDEFRGSVQGFECVMLECMHLANSGNLRRAWPAALADDSPSGRFERKQCAIASRILARNESLLANYSDDCDSVSTLDLELQQAANEMPSKWWLVPNLASSLLDEGLSFWEMLRLVEQMLYFNLLNLLHLPYMLRSRMDTTRETGERSDYVYSKLVSVNASRELLTRYIMLRSHNRLASTSRAMDFFAMTAAITLIMAHLGGHDEQRAMSLSPSPVDIDILPYHRNSDRAMMEKVLENMEAMADLSTDLLSKQSASLLRRLLVLEAKAAKGQSNMSDAEGGLFLHLGIPHFGTIKINSNGTVVSVDSSEEFLVDSTDAVDGDTATSLNAGPSNDVVFVSQPSQHAEQISPNSPLAMQPQQQGQNQLILPHYSHAIDDALDQQYPYAGLTAHAEDWGFQSTDAVFFEDLMGESSMQFGSDDRSILMR
ncbi:hypothetical protein E8E13_000550 [Curvularia kusanoi]|uniref:Uncharacterized protein n=1 Tax=Curvularia kusanoi TaxID=90978 RepID=A0A9P4T3V0_CURKU|nr:hypothetical protein E8E13_000550 [Curvularia kusanoi]